ncbi:MAG: signal peptidase I [Bacillota bacterium]|nr:signal peptidase I [Bacillota bacterium]
MYLLLVDQNFVSSAELQKMLEKTTSDADIVSCFSVDTLRKLAGKVEPDVIIIDFDLVDEDPAELLSTLRIKSHGAHILAFIEPDHFDALFSVIEKDAIDDYLVKPIRKEDFIARVHILEKKKSTGVDISAPYSNFEEEEKYEKIDYYGHDIEEIIADSDQAEKELEIEELQDYAETEEPEIIRGIDEPVKEEEAGEDIEEVIEIEEIEFEEELEQLDTAGFDDLYKPAFTGETDDVPDKEQTAEDMIREQKATEFLGEDEPVGEMVQEPVKEEDLNFGLFDDSPPEEPASSATSEFDNVFGTKPPIKNSAFASTFDNGKSVDDLEPDSSVLESFREKMVDTPYGKAAKGSSEKVLPDAGSPDIEYKPVFDYETEGEQYFDDLFGDKELKEEKPFVPQAEQPEIKIQSSLPGKSADDFLFGEDILKEDLHIDEDINKPLLDQFAPPEEVLEEPVPHKIKKPTKVKGAPKRGVTRILSIFGNLIFILLLLMMATLSFFLIQSRISGGAPQIAGHEMYIVMSDSMNPEFYKGSLAFVRETPPQEIFSNDIITYHSPVNPDSLVTHRVVEVRTQGGYSYITRGDANPANDPNPVPSANVVGRVVYTVPYIGYLLDFVQTREGLILLIFVPGALIIIYELVKIVRYMREDDDGRPRKKKGKISEQ